MAMFTAYFDASGNAREQPFVVVAGYLANYLQWRAFEDMWTRVHIEFNVEPPFHMSDLVEATRYPLSYANQKNARRDYIELAKDPKKARDFLLKIVLAQVTIVNCSITAIVPMDVYNGVSSLLDLRKVVPPYALGARMCLAQVNQWEREFDVKEPVECIFEEGDFEQGKFTDLMVGDGAPAPIYKKKSEYAGLQGADQYAWERAYFSKNVEGTDLPARGSFDLLVDTIPKLHMEATTASLIHLCHARKIDPKTGVQHDK
jgi:hypothetical protein